MARQGVFMRARPSTIRSMGLRIPWHGDGEDKAVSMCWRWMSTDDFTSLSLNDHADTR